MNKEEYVSGERFHSEIKKIYNGEIKWAVNKNSSKMAKVVYDPAHLNKKYEGEKRGKGKDFATWVFSEEKGTEESIFSTNLELMIDTTMEPNASIGLHFHDTNEEIYYILEGSIRMTTITKEEQEHTEELFKGDAHMVKLNQGHYGTAGENGVRFITVAVKK
ncbi:MAG: cupin domain-containing protein [Bacillota bacterium]|nr:cupin domain-containing protein [Bacillota bacterium]